ncbi:MAG TPA: AAA family ATPase [Acidocella sp.]|nr:AAA family ATPase [Acidocella sp.]
MAEALNPPSRLGVEGDSGLQVLWQDGECVFCRAWRQGANGDRDAVLAVSPAGEHPVPATLDRLTHEFGLKDELDGAWAARPLELARHRGRPVLMLEDPGGEPLDRLLGAPLKLGRFLRLAIRISAALSQMHRRGLVHKDIKPANILVNRASGEIRLTGFGITSRLSRERQAPAPPETIAGTLAYMAPEQTGRMNRSIDSRSDLYALGVTFYQMLTGALPFTASEPMEWVHCHVARRPVPPASRLKEVPEAISALVMKLLAKTAEERYQTAAGVERDLRRCLAEWEARARITAFPLGLQDASDHLLIPERLYGREREIETLLAAFDRVVKSGTPELVLVAGYSGIGKSSVVNELHRALVPPRGLFASGKFEQYQRDIPYATIAQAFQGLVRSFLSRSEAELSRARDRLVEALGPNAGLMIDIVPELKLILGDQPPVPELPPQDAQRRFQLVFRRFLGVFARPEHPLALFLDDLQWLDAATLDLFEHVLTHPDVHHLLLIGAFRDNEVTAAHPLVRRLTSIRQAGTLVQDILLTPLKFVDLRRLIADALHCHPDRAAPLARLVHEKTGGNPFFTIQFLTALDEEGLLAFDHGKACWSWDLDRIQAKGFTDNVLALMLSKLGRLPVETRGALRVLACLGNATSATLTAVYGGTEEALHAALWAAVRAGLVFRHEGGGYRFLHDRVQEAAYALLPACDQAAAHLRIGRLLAARTAPEALEANVFEIVRQLNRGAALLSSVAERDWLAGLNLLAGKRAKATTAYSAALVYCTTGEALLAEDRWERCPELSFALAFHRASCEFLTGALADAESRLTALSSRAGGLLDLAAVTCLQEDLYTTLDRSDRSIEVALGYLRRVGIVSSAHPTKEEVRREYERMWQQIGSRPIEALLDLPRMADPVWRGTLDVLSAAIAPAMFTDQNLYSVLICRMVTLSLEHGNGDASSYAYTLIGAVLGGLFGDYQAGFRFGQLGFNLAEKLGQDRFKANVYLFFGHHILPWTKPIRLSRSLLRRALDAAQEAGDPLYGAFIRTHLVTHLFASGDPLDEVQKEAEAGLDFARKARFGLVVDRITGQLQLIRMLRGLTAQFGRFDDARFAEAPFEQHLQADPRLALAACWYWIRKLQARVFAGDHAGAVAAAVQAEGLLWTTPLYFERAEFHFYAALARAALCDTAPEAERAGHREALAAHHRQIQTWAGNCPENFANRAALVSAEIARLEGRELDAERLYEQAISSARTNGFIQNEALSLEHAARFYAARGFETIARTYLQDARYGYLRWGAEGKVRHLDERHPQLRAEEPTPAPTGTIGAPVEHLDLATVIKASQAVSGEIVPDRLMETLMTIALEHAGAERGLLLLLRDEILQIEAEARTAGAAIEVTLQPAPVAPSVLPETVLHTVTRTQRSVILDNATAQYPFAADAYIRQTQARSVLCLPLVKQARLIGALYLENRLTSHIFTPSRIAVLELLASQAAISLENAQLYADLRTSEARWRNLFESVPVGVTLTGPNGRYLAANPAFQKMTGYSEAELRDLSPLDISHEDDRAATAARIAARAAGTDYPQHVEKRIRRKDGSVIWVDASAFVAPVMAGPPHFAGAAIEITDRKRVEEELRRSEALLAQAQQISRTGSWRWHVATGAVSWSTEHFHIFDFDPAAMQPTYDIFMSRVQPEDRAALEHALDHAVRTKSRFDHEYRIVLPDGTVKYLQSVGEPDSAEGRDLEFVGTVMDITERKRAEEALQNAQADLIRAARLTTMGELLASIAHEINQPLAAVATSGGACLRWLNRDQPDLAAARNAVARVVRDAHRAGEVIRSLRTLAQKAGPQLTTLDIRNAIEDVLVLTRGELQQHGIVLHTSLAAGAQPVCGDKVQLQQVLLNLVMNGIQAMATVPERKRELTISIAQAGPDCSQVTVEDTGPGLDPAIARRVFDPFFSTKPDGLGMGLSISRSIIDAHGGQLWASPRAPHGTAFHFTIPVVAKSRAAPAPE